MKQKATIEGSEEMAIGWYLHDHLFASKERVSDEFTRAQGYWLLTVCHD